MTMTKSREIELLDAFIRQLGPDSYLGPWLTESRDQIVTDIRNDFCISAPMPGAAQAIAVKVLNDAGTEAEALVARAKEQAATIIERANDERDRTVERVERYLDRIANDVRRLGVPRG
jgi:cell division septum initiation protein DivIVA